MAKAQVKAQEADLNTRVERLRGIVNSTPTGRKTMLALVPATRLHSDPNIMDWSDWEQFSQWPQST